LRTRPPLFKQLFPQHHTPFVSLQALDHTRFAYH
jgi:hypothetical protein